jgi:hypothetical protein
MVAIEIYVHKNSFLSLQLLSEIGIFPYLHRRIYLVELTTRKNVYSNIENDKQEENGSKAKYKRDVKY